MGQIVEYEKLQLVPHLQWPLAVWVGKLGLMFVTLPEKPSKSWKVNLRENAQRADGHKMGQPVFFAYFDIGL